MQLFSSFVLSRVRFECQGAADLLVFTFVAECARYSFPRYRSDFPLKLDFCRRLALVFRSPVDRTPFPPERQERWSGRCSFTCRSCSLLLCLWSVRRSDPGLGFLRVDFVFCTAQVLDFIFYFINCVWFVAIESRCYS
jgi:hypothetical protein